MGIGPNPQSPIRGGVVRKRKNYALYVSKNCIGIFKNGLINGKGTYINNNGEKYKGNFQGNKKNGYGKLYDKNGTLIKEGIWENEIFIENE